ncbi:DAGAT-domain-containing protein [Multifurca ochricompacta]|uniref:Diacylglycerol O-acyltransferase n=1 Tax=Multifurca ochricompacta TaxID=376703 RepID=A0AAD4QNF2_9AGAM|nr:DAGAT-domain-containing protein [Multifurca ochricompacta]
MTERRNSFSSTSSLSASSLKERLSRLSVTPLRPVAALQARVDFVPASIPRVRRLQTVAVALWTNMIPICFSLTLFLFSYPPVWPFMIAYIIWIHIDSTPERGGRMSPWFRSIRFWKFFAEYYPASYKKASICFLSLGFYAISSRIWQERDLPADRPYLFGYHPHGIISIDSTGFSRGFPGVRPHLLTLNSNFTVPFYREILLLLGVCSVSKRSCERILRKGNGSAIAIVVGGAAESLSAHPGTADLTLRKRLGFIKLAIREGADLVPVFSFGENDIYEQMPNEKGTTLYAIQKKFQNIFGFTLPLFHGRGILNYNWGLLPYRRQIIAVVGRPVHVQKMEKPNVEQIREVQEAYIAELMRIWNTYKDEFARTRTRELSIIA